MQYWNSRNHHIQTSTIVALITLLGAFVRFYHLAFKSLWLDEAVVYWISQGSIREVVRQNAGRNSAPFAHALLLNIISTIDDSVFTLRGISAIAGVLAIPLIFLLAKEYIPLSGAYLVTLLVAISRTQVQYSQQLREYSIAFLLATLIILTFTYYVKQPTWKNGIILVAVWVASVSTQYGLALLITALNAVYLLRWVQLQKRSFAGLARWGVSQLFVLGAVAIVYAFALRVQLQVGFGSSEVNDYLAAAYWDQSVGSLGKLLFVNSYDIFKFAYPFSGSFSQLLSASLFCLFVVGIYVAIHQKKFQLIQLLFFPFIIAFCLALARLYPYHGDRQIIFLLPMIYIFIGSGFSYLLEVEKLQFAAWLVAAVVLAGGVFSTFEYLNWTGIENINPIVDRLETLIEKDDEIYIYYGAEPAFTYYFRDFENYQIKGVYSPNKPQNYLNQLDEAVLANQNRSWLVMSHCTLGECDLIRDYVSETRTATLIIQDNDAQLYLVESQ